MRVANPPKRSAWSALALFLIGLSAQAQCVVFKSEITDVKDYEITVGSITDSLKVVAETAAFAARYSEGMTNARQAEQLAGKALAAAQEAVNYAAEAQYHAEVCGLKDVVSHAIKAEALAVDTRDFADIAYTSAKKARSARSLGDVHYFMRQSLVAARNASRTSEKAIYAAFDAHQSCTHTDGDATAGRN